jgi:hypothetical protein
MRSAIFAFIVAISGAAVAHESLPASGAPPPAAETTAPAPAKRTAAARPAKIKRKRQPAVKAWGDLGINRGHVQAADKNCLGGQYGAALKASALYLRWSRTSVSYEASDHTGTCDGLLSGDSGIRESAWTGGFVLGRSGLFMGIGGTDVNVERTFDNDVDFGRDHGRRYEVGYSSLLKHGSGIGYEIKVFRGLNDVRDYTGLAFGFTLGN